ncbi:endo alpha-1,4 polygalactosaminidase [Micromonospora sp. NPDC000207]|uniref:endo alpha-1,4 polygalactosaminidase n=1 Tax=Micromonospora sp. NPDC000207 TaxID=3154246 RepID=UPI00332D3DDA
MAWNRKQVRAGLAVTAAVTVALGVGIGAAGASGRQHWWGGGEKQPAPTSSPTSEVGSSPATQAPDAPPSVPATTAPPSPSATPSPTTSTSASPSAKPTVAPTASTRAATPTATSSPSATRTRTTAAATWTPPPGNARFDYQIGRPYPPASGVRVVSRDMEASPAPGLYNICYVNAFQAQPGAESWWKNNHPELLLRDARGNLVVDEGWNELMFDFSTAAKRTALTRIVGGWIDQCARKGFKAIEPDNLDSYLRSKGLLTHSQAVAYATSLASYAHGKGLAVAQKNLAELTTAEARRIGFDFAVAEECATWNECDAYTRTYGDRVIVIEYTRSSFDKACRSHGSTLSVVLRDLNVTAPGSGSYVSKAC